MEAIDNRTEHLIAQALKQAGVLPTDGDARELRRYALNRYRRIKNNHPQWKRQEVLVDLVKVIQVRRHRGWAYQQEEIVRHGQQQAGRYEWLEVKPTQDHDLAHLVQLTPNERDVLYLLVVAGMSPEQIVEKLGASGDWVAVTIAKLRNIYGEVW
jgi:DNA-directed RNA polymerase specialized sigma24 family protein